MKDTIKAAFLGMIYGDAAGYTIDGMGKGHIRSTFGGICGFIEPMDGLKGHYERWRKPGLYSGVSQLALCAAAATRGRMLHVDPLRRILAESDIPYDSSAALFRNPGRLISNFADSCRNNGLHVAPVTVTACGIPVAASAALSVSGGRMPEHGELLAYSAGLGADIDASCAAALFSRILYCGLIGTPPENLLLLSADQAGEAAEWSNANAPELFSLGFNSDKIAAVFRDYERLFRVLAAERSRENAEKAVIAAVNRRVKTPVTRCTVDHPFALFPFSVILTADHAQNAEHLLFECAQEGGAASVLSCLSGMLAGAFALDGLVPGVLSTGLINRRQIEALVDKLSEGRADAGDAAAFLKGEIALTVKESQERDARLKHKNTSAPAGKKEKGKSDERALTRHVVESWTKLDKARWKKEQQHMRDDEET